jgi:ParB-like chromosome segregation protein Spo0J
LTGDGKKIRGGLRRAAAAQQVLKPHDLVPVRFVPNDDVTGAAMTLIENWHRSANIVSEHSAVETLIRAGYEEDDIAEELGVSPARVRKLLKLSTLPPTIQAAIAKGTVRGGLALALTALDPKRQKQIASAMDEGEPLTASLVNQARVARKKETVADLPTELFDGGGLTGEAALNQRMVEDAAIRARVAHVCKVTGVPISSAWAKDILKALQVVAL